MGERVLLAQGREAEVFLQSDGTVLKLQREPSSGRRVDREASVLATLAACGIAGPTLVGTTVVDGRPGLVVGRLDGGDLLAALGRRPHRVRTAGRVLGEVHAAMHEVVAPPDLPDLRADLEARIAAASLPEALRSGALEVLATLPDGDRLCHGDLHLGNLMGSWAEPVAIDWGDACRGDPTADVARTDILQRMGIPPPGASAVLRVLAPVGHRPLVTGYLAAYRRARGLDAALLDRWRIVRAAARMSESVPSEHPRLLRFLDRALRRGGGI